MFNQIYWLTNNVFKKQRLNLLFFSSFGSLAIGLCGIVISGLVIFGIIEKNIPTKIVSAFLLIIAIGLLLFSSHQLHKIRKNYESVSKEKSQKLQSK